MYRVKMIAACAYTTAIAAVLCAGTASAQDMNPPVIYAEPAAQSTVEAVEQPVLKPTIDDTQTAANPLAKADMSNRWVGGYAGLQMAYTTLKDSLPAEGNGVTYGALVGYNIPVMGKFVAGLEAGYNHMNIEFDDGSGVRGKDTFSARMRGGYAADRFYAYGLIGAEHALATAPFAPGYKFKDTTLVLGAGVDVAVTDRISVGVEYTRSFFKEFNYPTFPIPVDVTMQKLQSRLIYKIN
jgi:outer membrane immunogenic protein